MIPGETILSQRAMGMPEDPHTGEFKVLRSQGSGLYYVGTMLVACGDENCRECGDYPVKDKKKGSEIDYNSRETDYFKTREEAERALEEYNKNGVLAKQRT